MDLRSDMLAEIITDPRVGTDLAARLELVVETGAVDRLVGEYAQDHAVNLTVVGSHGHDAIFEAVIGSTERKLREWHTGYLLILSTNEGWTGRTTRFRSDKKKVAPLLPRRDRP